MDYAALIGFVAAAIGTASFLPQAVKAWRTKSTRDISLVMYIGIIIGLALWLAYGFLIGSLPIIIANIITIIIAVSVLIAKIRYG